MTDVELGADLGVGESLRREPGDVGLLQRELRGDDRLPLADGLPRGDELSPRALANASSPIPPAPRTTSATGASVAATTLPAQPLTVELARASSTLTWCERGARFLRGQPLGRVALTQESPSARLDAQAQSLPETRAIADSSSSPASAVSARRCAPPPRRAHRAPIAEDRARAGPASPRRPPERLLVPTEPFQSTARAQPAMLIPTPRRVRARPRGSVDHRLGVVAPPRMASSPISPYGERLLLVTSAMNRSPRPVPAAARSPVNSSTTVRWRAPGKRAVRTCVAGDLQVPTGQDVPMDVIPERRGGGGGEPGEPERLVERELLRGEGPDRAT